MALKKTQSGHAAFKARAIDFSASQRAAYILFDGTRETTRVLAQTGGIGFSMDDVEHLMALGFLEEAGPTPVGAVSAAGVGDTVGGVVLRSLAPTPGTGSDDFDTHASYHAAYPLAIKLASGLGIRGFMLNLAVERATSFEELVAVAPKLRDAVGEEKFTALRKALGLF